LHVGPTVIGRILKEEKVEQAVLGGSQATSFEELNHEQGNPGAYSAYGSNMTCLLFLYCMWCIVHYI
jgi:hypothetical protein